MSLELKQVGELNDPCVVCMEVGMQIFVHDGHGVDAGICRVCFNHLLEPKCPICRADIHLVADDRSEEELENPAKRRRVTVYLSCKPVGEDKKPPPPPPPSSCGSMVAIANQVFHEQIV